ncbi:hypothetical protein VNO78_24074 [Psophocarpus tetragonolobus]|uniref:Uncharacterized protein n=1 Tax=Psophocarpus tetragonolobus TaxID=3891 RepID=A0AAN9S4S1_PSOTE
MAAKDIDIHAIRVESHFFFTTGSFYFIVRRRFIHVNVVVASSFISHSVLYFFSIVLSDVINSRFKMSIQRTSLASKLVKAVVNNYSFLGVLIHLFFLILLLLLLIV